jgi:hypothetical protein
MVVALALLGGSCARPRVEPPPLHREPIVIQLRRAEPLLSQYPYSPLLDFESDADLVFTSDASRVAGRDAHTGESAARIPAGARQWVVKLGSVMIGRAFPADWTLAVAYFHTFQRTAIRPSFENGATSHSSPPRDIAPGRWTAVYVNLTAIGDGDHSGDRLVFHFDPPAPADLLCDDVLLVDNHRTFGPAVRQAGFHLIVERPNQPALDLPTELASVDGWRVVEAGAMRVLLASDGRVKRQAILADGRVFLDGAPSANVGSITCPPEQGRVDRATDGDTDNDGYNECRGAYEIVAVMPRVDVVLSPPKSESPLDRPVLEIAHLPAGAVTATMEGQWLEQVERLDNGNVLIALPATVARPVTISVSVSASITSVQ